MKIQEIAEERRKEKELSEALQEFAGYEIGKENRKVKTLAVIGVLVVISAAIAILSKKKQ